MNSRSGKPMQVGMRMRRAVRATRTGEAAAAAPRSSLTHDLEAGHRPEAVAENMNGMVSTATAFAAEAAKSVACWNGFSLQRASRPGGCISTTSTWAGNTGGQARNTEVPSPHRGSRTAGASPLDSGVAGQSRGRLYSSRSRSSWTSRVPACSLARLRHSAVSERLAS